MREFLQTWNHYAKHGVLPEAGGMMDQSATWFEACTRMTSLENAYSEQPPNE